MGTASKYWLLVRIDSFGNCLTQEVEEAKAFFNHNFPEFVELDKISDREIQSQLMQWFKSDLTRYPMADICLRCFISSQIKEICLELEQKFGRNHQFTSSDILPLVIDSKLPASHSENPSDRLSVTSRILQTFDPNKSNLSTWTLRIVKSDRLLKQFLLEHGIEQVTDWMLLSYTNPGRLKRILSDFDRTPAEINQAIQLLSFYHQIYRDQLFAHRKAGDKSRYPDPTPLQLQKMAEELSKIWVFSAQDVLEKLKNLAQLIRSDRLRSRNQSSRFNSLKESSKNIPLQEEKPNEQSEFLAGYLHHFETCLEQSVQQVIQARFTYLQTKKNCKAQNFIKALHLFHCQGVPMKEIAPQLGLNNQPQVSRLLALKALRSDIGRRMLLCLRTCVLNLAKCYVDPLQLLTLESQVQTILSEEIAAELEKAKKEAHIGHNRVMNNQLSQAICQYLDRRIL
ncbi:hypothetical protein H6G20_05190 [Desertifilum sp. FACHB-1129]|uniref:hypothetical protein n=1 Tax=unclassified Desertifilum TaxID=2621682 RepID=UPI0016868AF4|nr:MULTISPECIES: hypothetical protein [unclassified Desertifilum]MBD2311081.1 hypothetical protein [Desertifilum sp. FACHB-1129]MBD2323948.1 hypothetical protein [Desertifilum sp. FACHB-866]MBD2333883.1 hypothetical protein [Desertifilum sp. FACHB-868]MDA0211194.1 hypothetical protein [Cyanobacteria bacterium FC1]